VEGTQIAEDLFRRQWARLLAALVRFLGPAHIALAEDVVQDALLSALQAWRFGVPDDPHGWLLKTAKNRAIDRLRRDRRFNELSPALASEWTLAAAVDAAFLPTQEASDQIAMMVACCHEELSEETHVTLILRFLCGFGVKEIAQAFLLDVGTIDRRVHRGRERLRTLGQLSVAGDARQYLPSVMRALYLLFNEGYHGSDPDNPVRSLLCAEALRLVAFLLESPATSMPEVHALAALFCFHSARLSTRQDAAGVFVPLAEQDRSRWDRDLLVKGVSYLSASASGAELTRWHLEAGIACEHSMALSIAETNWAQIVDLYDALDLLAPSPVIRLNRALAVAEHQGVEAGLLELQQLRGQDQLSEYPFYWAALADLESRKGSLAAAVEFYGQAIEFSRSRAERAAYQRKVARLREQLSEVVPP
jgi:RNA polymerase sigma factor (sigma-70 family)